MTEWLRPLPPGDAPTGASTRALSRPGWLQWAGLLAGVGLLTAAIMMVWRQREPVAHALASIHSLPTGRLAYLVLYLSGSTLANVGLSGLMFSVLIRRYGRVGVMEMQALIAGATLVNHLPVRMGWVGRLAYHRAVNGIAISDSIKTVVQAIAISGAVAAYCSASALAAAKLGLDLRMLVLAPLPLMVGGFFYRGGRGTLLLASLPRYLEALIVAGRYYVAFSLIGSPINASSALALACVSMISTIVPVPGTGLGLREWAVGLFAPMLAGTSMELGITADLINRAAESVVALLTGSIGVAYLLWRVRSASGDGGVPPPLSPSHPSA